jgi:ABC-2 type transport system ATP-binding protein
MKQRVKLAQAVVHDPMIVFLDEPTNGMDPSGRDEMLSLIKRIHRDLGITVVVSSHLLEDIERVCDYVVMIDRGKLVASGRIDEMMRGGGDIIVRVDGDSNLFSNRLSGHGVTSRINGPEIIVAMNGGSHDVVFDAIRDTVVELDMPLRELRARERSLEDVYIQTVGGETTAEEALAHGD